MVPSELMFNFLKQQGFCPEVEEYGIAFKYQMKNFIFWKNDDDRGFFQLILPGIFDVNEENINTVLHAANRVNCDLKVAKANVMNGESVWLFFEILIDGTPVFEDLVPRALDILLGAQAAFYKSLQEV